jgi:predicted ATPase
MRRAEDRRDQPGGAGHAGGEQIFAVRSLSLPATTDLESTRLSEAVRRFTDHARLVSPDFELTERNAGAIAEICRRLDGIALAIELAAARVRVLSVDEIRARLDDRFRLLTGGNRSIPRHQTLQATMQWSHDLLTAREQRCRTRTVDDQPVRGQQRPAQICFAYDLFG